MQHHRWVIWVLLVVLIQTGNIRLNHQVSESVRGCGKDIGDAGVHAFIIARVGRQLPGDEVRTNDVMQVVSEGDDLEDKEEKNSLAW